MIEAYIAIVLLALGAAGVVICWADDAYQRARREQRQQQRQG